MNQKAEGGLKLVKAEDITPVVASRRVPGTATETRKYEHARVLVPALALGACTTGSWLYFRAGQYAFSVPDANKIASCQSGRQQMSAAMGRGANGPSEAAGVSWFSGRRGVGTAPTRYPSEDYRHQTSNDHQSHSAHSVPTGRCTAFSTAFRCPVHLGTDTLHVDGVKTRCPGKFMRIGTWTRPQKGIESLMREPLYQAEKAVVAGLWQGRAGPSKVQSPQ
ncbi:hypothetical protein BBK36DRAFT_1194344 [Trichoderma citrinoviride]|uniref:Uncharacterized protein n=1 Tax=Trichoderma citrinoviride TaxID=58853 RepID=A0A2T4BF25_9HYPO|nr:hypothetical protein BBK36DRAFT_1194344 [Trichoderma citrinoviride]PTB67942.1 hypothetical protein BBK36DRAFT_1194344 [Trichoderma citrinoviride]